MSMRLEQLAARRRLLQLQCAVQRGEIAEIEADLDAGAARVDRVVAMARRFTPLLLVTGVVIFVAIGPGRALGLVSRGLAAATIANRAARLLR